MSSLGQKFISNSFWMIIGRGSSTIANFFIFVLLARILGPTEFGLVAFSAIFVDVTRSLAFAGIPQALIQRSHWDDDVASAAFSANVALAMFFSIIVAFAIAPIVTVFSSDRLGPIISILSVTLIIDALRGIHEAKLQREFQFKVLASRGVVATLVGGLAGILLAFSGAGAWALVGSRLINSITQTTFVWLRVRWIPRPSFDFRKVKPLLNFGIHFSGAAVLGQLNARVADIIIGSFIGTTAVGIYRVGGRGLNLLVTGIINPMQSTALTSFSRLTDNAAIGRAYLRVTRVCAVVGFPLYFVMAVVAPDFVVACFGQQWVESGLVMSMLALMGGAAIPGYFAQSALAAAGRSDWALAASITAVSGNLVAALIAVHFGVVWVAFACALRTYCTVPFGFYLVQKATGISIIHALRNLAPSFLCASLMAGCLFLIKHFYLGDSAVWTRLIVLIPSGILLYCAFMLMIAQSSLSEIRHELKPIWSRLGLKG